MILDHTERLTYGPHDPTTAPTTVTVFRRADEGDDYQDARPVELIEQRAQINTLAAGKPRGGAR